MKFQRLIALCCLLTFIALYPAAGAQAAAPQIDYYRGVTKAWSADTIIAVMQCEIPSSMGLTEAKKNIYRVGFGEGYDYGYEKYLAEAKEQFSQEGFTLPNASEIIAEYKTNTFSMLLPATWYVGTRTSYQQASAELEAFFADYFIDFSDMVLIALSPVGSMVQITQTEEFCYDPAMATFTDEEIALSKKALPIVLQQYAADEAIALTDVNITSLCCPQGTFLICNATLDYADTDYEAYVLNAYLLTNPDSAFSCYDFYIDYVSDYAFTAEDIAQFQDILLSIHFEENVPRS